MYFSHTSIDFSYFGLPARLYISNLKGTPNIYLFGTGRVSDSSSLLMFFRSLFRSEGPSIFTSAPVYNASPGGSFLVVLQAASKQANVHIETI